MVAFNAGAHYEVVTDKRTGFLAKTTREFDDQLEILVEDDRLREKMGKKAAEHAKKFSWNSSVRLFENVVEKV